jgi:uncharacterized protein YecE (DUF72 family)
LAVFVGASGWQYDSWLGVFYPARLAKTRWLEHYAAAFATVEVNNTFYRLPAPATFMSWAARTPDDFVVSVKASRYLTHVRRLRQPEEPVRRLMEAAQGLGQKLGVVLVQLPPDLPARFTELDRTLASFPRHVRVAVEARHPSWYVDELRAVLTCHDAALCLADRHSRPVTPLWRTASWGYLRMHEGRGQSAPGYGRSALASWASRVAELFGPERDVYVYFNNDTRGCAPGDARRFAVALTRAGLHPTRTTAAAAAPG